MRHHELSDNRSSTLNDSEILSKQPEPPLCALSSLVHTIAARTRADSESSAALEEGGLGRTVTSNRGLLVFWIVELASASSRHLKLGSTTEKALKPHLTIVVVDGVLCQSYIAYVFHS